MTLESDIRYLVDALNVTSPAQRFTHHQRTAAMLLAVHGHIPPKEYAHDPSLCDD